MRAIDDDPEPVEAQVLRQRTLGIFDIALLGALDARRAADLVGGHQQLGGGCVDQRLDLELGFVGQLEAVGIEKLDAIVGELIVRGRDHDADIGTQRPREHGDSGRRHGAELEHIDADGREARHQRILDHVAREPGVLADHRPLPVAARLREHLARRHADLERDFGSHRRRIGKPPDAVRAKILARHLTSLLAGRSATGAERRDHSARVVAPRPGRKRELSTARRLYFNPGCESGNTL